MPVLFEYANVPVYMRLTLGQKPRKSLGLWFQGIIELTEFALSYSPQAGLTWLPATTATDFRAA